MGTITDQSLKLRNMPFPPSPHELSPKKRKSLLFFWIGFSIYTFSYVLTKTTYVNYIWCQAFQTISIAIFSISSIKLFQFKLNSQYLLGLVCILLIWSVITILRGIPFGYDGIKETLFDSWFGTFAYLAPLIIFFPKKLETYEKTFTLILIFGAVFLVYSLIFIKDIFDDDLENLTSQYITEYFVRALSLPCGYFLLTFRYHSRRKLFFVITIIVITLLFVVFRARRTLILLTIAPIILAYSIYLLQSIRTGKNKLLALVTLAAAVLLVFNAGDFIATHPIFDAVNKRGLEDTRTGVEIGFYRDLSAYEWIIGRGISGEYFFPGIDPGPSPYRKTIETDYLHIILKGGLIKLIVLLMIMIPAAIKGIFFSQNLLSRASGIWIFIWLASLYPINVTNYSLSYLLVWLSVGICYSKEIRSLPESTLVQYFNRP